VRQICGISRVRVAKKDHGQFIALQALLGEDDIEYDTYALSVVNAWWPWCAKRRMKTVPPSIFCGKKAWNRYRRECEVFSADTKSDDDEHAAVYYELLYAKLLISNILQSEQHPPIARRVIRYALGNAERFGRRIDKAMEILCEAYGVEADSYNDLAQKIRARS
jgi:hypothetical protein